MEGKTLKLGDEFMSVFLIASFCFFLISCGLDNVIYLEAPTITHSDYDSEDDFHKYLEFETAESKNASVKDYVKGSEIYYRIYERKGERSNDYSAIYKYNEDNPGVSATYLLESKKYKILSLSGASDNDRPLIKKTASNKKIRLRFIKYDNEEAGLYINGTLIALPLRYNGKAFKKDDISKNHEDVTPMPSSSTEEDEYWYINMYAATYGNDKSFKPLYSKLEFIGFLRIKKQ